MVEKNPNARPFPVNGPVWLMHRESVLAPMAGHPALLLQAAYPGATQGVIDHSAYKARVFRRIFETATIMDRVTYQTYGQSQAMLAEVREKHKKVHGRLDHSVGAHKERDPYSALNREALTWVGIMFIKSVAQITNDFLFAMTPAQLDDYYQQAKNFLPLFGGKVENAPPHIRRS